MVVSAKDDFTEAAMFYAILIYLRIGLRGKGSVKENE